MNNTVQPFTTITYTTADGEKITATKNNGIVTLVGDKSGTRQMELEEFKNEFLATLPQLERTPSSDAVSFSGKAEEAETEAPKNQEPKKEASTAKKVGVGLSSFLLTGLGQLINGDVKKGLAFLGGSICITTILGMMGLGPLALAVGLGIKAGSIVDSVKNA